MSEKKQKSDLTDDFSGLLSLEPDDFKDTSKKGIDESIIYTPDPIKYGKDENYKAIIRFIPWYKDPKKKSKFKIYHYWLTNPEDNTSFSVHCPSTIGEKSLIQDVYFKLYNSNSSADKSKCKLFKRKETYYSLIKVIKDIQRPENDGKLFVYKYPKAVADLIESEIKPVTGEPVIPFDIINARDFLLHVRTKTVEGIKYWNYDLCKFVGEAKPISIDGAPITKTSNDIKKAYEWLKDNSPDLEKFEYKKWTEDEYYKIVRCIEANTKDSKVIGKLMGFDNDNKSKPANVTSKPANATSKPPISNSDKDDILDEFDTVSPNDIDDDFDIVSDIDDIDSQSGSSEDSLYENL